MLDTCFHRHDKLGYVGQVVAKKKKKLTLMEAAWEGVNVFSGNPADICDALLPKLLSGEIRVKEAGKFVSDKV